MTSGETRIHGEACRNSPSDYVAFLALANVSLQRSNFRLERSDSWREPLSVNSYDNHLPMISIGRSTGTSALRKPDPKQERRRSWRRRSFTHRQRHMADSANIAAVCRALCLAQELLFVHSGLFYKRVETSPSALERQSARIDPSFRRIRPAAITPKCGRSACEIATPNQP